MALVKLHGRQSFSTSWCVEGGFGIPGDSGAWVYEPVSGGLCGHVLAWGDKSKTAYIAPMEVLFEDIRTRLGASTVELPVPCRPGVQANRVYRSRQDEGSSTRNNASAQLAMKLRNLRIDSSNTDKTMGVSSRETGTGPGGQDVVGVRPLFMAGTVS